jgi:hypothetical protein
MDGTRHAARCPGTLRAVLESTHTEDLEDAGWSVTTSVDGSETWRRGDLRITIVRDVGFGMGIILAAFRGEKKMPSVTCESEHLLHGAVGVALDLLTCVDAIAAETGGSTTDALDSGHVTVGLGDGRGVDVEISGSGRNMVEYTGDVPAVTVACVLFDSNLEFIDESSIEMPLDATSVGMAAARMVRELAG